MRALESFHEAEQLRLALRDTLRVQREIQEADLAIDGTGNSSSRIKRLPTPSGENDSLRENDCTLPMKLPLSSKAVVFSEEGQSLIGTLPDAVVLDDILGKYLDFDTILLIIPSVSKDWNKAIWDMKSGALLWKKLCLRAWNPLNLPIKKSLSVNNDWQLKFLQRPRIRLSGPYITYTIFIQHPGPRNLWTPKDAPSVKVIYHYRFWWFREHNKVCYIALATRQPEKIIELMRREVLGHQCHAQPVNNNGEIQFWYGTYHLFRNDAGVLVCDVDVPQERHGVRFRFELCPGGFALRIRHHLSYRFKTPDDYMNHPVPEYEEDRLYRYRPGFV